MNCQIEKSSTATDYEPYTGGKPSPSPDYPQKISMIENLEVPVYGSNLFNLNRLRFTENDPGAKRYDSNTGIISAVNISSDPRSYNISNSDYVFNFSSKVKCHIKVDILQASTNSIAILRLWHNGNYGGSKEYNDYSLNSARTIEKDVWLSNTNSAMLFKLYDAKIKISVFAIDTTYSESFSWSTAKITLPSEHPFLASLPDGTHDELIVDKGGNVKLLARTWRIAVPSSVTDPLVSYNDIYNNYLSIGQIEKVKDGVLGTYSTQMCETNIVANPDSNPNAYGCMWSYTIPYESYTRLGCGYITDKNLIISKFKGYFTYYPLLDPIEYSLNSIDLPLQPDSILNIWALDEDNKDLIPEIEVTYERDLNAVIAKLESPKE